MKSVGIIMDVHGPFEDKRAYYSMMNAYAGTGLDALYIIGDFCDFYWIHGHGKKDPRVAGTFESEIEWANKALDEIDKQWPDIPKVFIEGNHEYRLERYLMNQAPEIFGMGNDVQTLLGFRSTAYQPVRRVNWNWIPYGPNQIVQVAGSKLYAKHENPPGAESTIAMRAGVNLVYGHCHRIRESHHVNALGKDHVAFSAGWIGNKKNSVFNYVKGHHLWQLGYCHVWVDEKTGYFDKNIVQIMPNYSSVLNGKLYKP